MKLLKLKLKNFMAHEDTEINFKTLGSPVLIKGVNTDRNDIKASNAAGKTSIFNAIDYCLFTKHKHRLRWGTDSGLVSLEFEHGGHVYLVEKHLTKDDYAPKLYKDDVLLSQQKKEIEKTVYEIIGIRKHMYEQTIYQNQMTLDTFGGLSKQAKTDFIMTIMDIAEWENHHTVARDMYKQISGDIASTKVKKEILERQQDTQKTELAGFNEGKLKMDLDMKQNILNEKNKLLQTYQQTENLMSQYNEVKSNKERAEHSLTSSTNKLRTNKEQLTKYTTMLEDIQQKKVTPVDENYKKNLLSSSLSLEKSLAAKEQQIASKNQEISDKEQKKPLVLQQAACPFCRRTMDDSYKVELERHLEGEILVLKELRDSYITERENIIRMRQSESQKIEEMNKQIQLYEEHVRTTEQVQSKLGEYTSLQAALQEQYDAAKREVDIYTAKFNDISGLLSKNAAQQIDTIRDDIKSLTVDMDQLRENISKIGILKSNIENSTAQIKELTVLLDTYTKALNKMQHVVNITSRTGIQKHLILEAMDDITVLTNSLLGQLGMSVNFKFEKAKKSTDGFKPVFDILVTNSYKQVCELDDLSGAEYILVNFAIRMALTILVANKYGFQYMISDEGIKDLDEPYREFMAGVIKNMSTQFQIFLITHFPDFENEFPNMLVVTKENGVSKILTK